jgi:hypothetical protein
MSVSFSLYVYLLVLPRFVVLSILLVRCFAMVYRPVLRGLLGMPFSARGSIN